MQIGKIIKATPKTLTGMAKQKGAEYLGVAGQSAAQKLREGKPFNQIGAEVLSEVRDRAMSEPGVKQVTQLMEQASQRQGTRVPTTSKGKGRGNGGNGGSSNNRGVSPDLSDYSQISGFEVPNVSSASVGFTSPLDSSLYENPFVMQGVPAENDVINNRTIFNVISLNSFDSHNSETILRDIFSSYKQAVQANTNGGTAATNTTFTFLNFKYYMQLVWKLQAHMIELMSRQAWAAESEYSNRVLRKHANYVGSETDLLKIRNRMATTLATLALPREFVSYSYWLFQVYRTNTHNIAVDQFFATDLYASELIMSDNITEYVAGIEALITDVVTQTNIFPQLTSFFLYKSGGTFVSLRNVAPPCNKTVYDKAFNDMFQNLGGHFTTTGTSYITVPPLVTQDYKTSVPGAFACGLNELPVHVTESLASRWNLNHPVLWKTSTVTGAGADYSFCSKYTMFETGTDSRGIFAFRRDTIPAQVGNDFITVLINSGGTNFTYWYIPQGDQSFLYEPSLNAIHLAQRIFVSKLFS